MVQVHSMSGRSVATLDNALLQRLSFGATSFLGALRLHLQPSLGKGRSQLRFSCEGHTLTEEYCLQDPRFLKRQPLGALFWEST